MENLEKIANKLSRKIFLKEIGINMSCFAIYIHGSAASLNYLTDYQNISLSTMACHSTFVLLLTLGSAASFHNLKNKILDYVQKSSSKDYVVNHTLRKHENYLRYLRS